jgi:hypothetical protein
MNSPLVLQDVINEVQNDLAGMEFEVPIFTNGQQTGTQTYHPSQAWLNQMSTAIGTSFYNILKNKVLINVQTDVTVTTPSGPGTGTGIGTGIVQ